jgi:thymidylate synthase (FAD)
VKVFVIGQTMIDDKEIDRYLEHIGVSTERRTIIRHQGSLIESHMERLVETEGRLCYKSWEPNLNPNVQRIREDTAVYLHNLIESGHGSVLEHATINFIVSGISRVFTHELVRHRVGTAFSQESMRFVRLGRGAEIRATPFLPDVARAALMFKVEALLAEVEIVATTLGLDNPKTSFDIKKKVTSDLRSFIPMGVLTEMGFSANIRSLRHMIEARTNPGAEQEIREIFNAIAEACLAAAPHLFADFERLPDGTWKPLYSKV